MLADACRKAWLSSSHSSALEDEPVREPAPAGNRLGAARRWESGSPSSAMEDETAVEAVPVSKAGERAAAGVRVLRLPLATTQLVEGDCLIRS